MNGVWWSYRRGRCAVCGQDAERQRRFDADTATEARQMAHEWEAGPVMHLRCEVPS